jgi:tRNA A-37 threonylcarbamoyl transferase component Bud32/tetratricopeptide (TPR) repeat protein
MDANRWNRLRSLYDVALDVPSSERRAALESHASDDPELVAEILAMLEREKEIGSLLDVDDGAALRREMERGAGLFDSGDLLAARFRVVRCLGTGGMGEVYEAEDERLGEKVAIKTVRVEGISVEKLQARLRQEAVLARKVTHPNVCRIHDVVEHESDGRRFALVTMELLRGETLLERIRRDGPLRLDAAELVARQVIAGLEAAHGAGIVHRDLKPGNVMLTNSPSSEERAVIMDFGLAIVRSWNEAVADNSPMTSTGAIVGTPAYMAPEQLRGGVVDERTDIYALGLLMYEMVAGQRPGLARSGIQECLNRILSPIPSPQTMRPEVDARWCRVILRCLEVDPSNRYGNVGEVRKAFAARRMLMDRMPSRRTMAAGLGVGACAGAAGIWYVNRGGLDGEKPFVVVANSAATDARLRQLGLLLRRQLQQSQVVKVWDSGEFESVRKAMRLEAGAPEELSAEQWRLLAVRVGAPFVAHLGVAPVAGEFAMSAVLERLDLDRAKVLRNWEFAKRFRAEAMAVEAVGETATWIRGVLGESREEIARLDRPVGLVTTGSLDALRLYEEAERVRSRNVFQAITLLKEAVRLDVDFGIAWMRLGDLQVSQMNWSEGILSWKEAVRLADAGRMSRREEHEVRTMYAMEIGELELVEAAAQRWIRDFPTTPRPYAEVFQSRLLQGRTQDALTAKKDLAVIGGNSRSVLLSGMVVGLWTGETALIEKGARAYIAAGVGSFHGERFLSCAAVLSGKWEEARRLGMELLKLKRSVDVSRGFNYMAVLDSYLGNITEARRWLREGLRYDKTSGETQQESWKWFGLAFLDWLEGRRAEVRVNALLGLEKGGLPTTAPEAVALLFRAGHVVEARRILNQWKMPVPSRRFKRLAWWMRGEESLATGAKEEGLEWIEKSVGMNTAIQSSEPRIHALVVHGKSAVAVGLAREVISRPIQLWYSPETDLAGRSLAVRRMSETKTI